MPATTKNLLRHLLDNSHQNKDGCWIWDRTISKGGYGQIGYKGKVWYVHRLAWTEFVSEIPDWAEVNHECRVRSCWRLDHLNLLTKIENSAQGDTPMRAFTTGICKRGHLKEGNNLYVDPKGYSQCMQCRRELRRR